MEDVKQLARTADFGAIERSESPVFDLRQTTVQGIERCDH
jgi:hypothetical protein